MLITNCISIEIVYESDYVFVSWYYFVIVSKLGARALWGWEWWDVSSFFAPVLNDLIDNDAGATPAKRMFCNCNDAQVV